MDDEERESARADAGSFYSVPESMRRTRAPVRRAQPNRPSLPVRGVAAEEPKRWEQEPTLFADEALLRDLDAEHVLRGRKNLRARYVKRRRSDGRTQWVHVTRWDA